MQKQLLLVLVLLLLHAACLLAQNRDINYLTSGGKLKPLQSKVDIRHYTLALDVDIAKQAINGYAEVELIVLQPTDTLLFDLVHLLRVHSIALGKLSAMFSQVGDSVFVTKANGFTPGRYTVKINYGGQPPVAVRPPWKGGFTWTTDAQHNPWVVINCQLQGGKVYFPCKDHPSDEPDEGADLFITIPNQLAVAGPGLLQSVKKQSKSKATWHWKTRYTISNYCILFNIGNYRVVSRPYTTSEGHTVPMQFYVLQQDSAQAAHVLDIRERDTRVLEKYFGEYPWIAEKIGIAQVPNPGMEHQTMITYGDGFVYKKYPTFDYSANLLHEFAHEWWANKITNKDWAHMWIQEGFATYAEALFFRDKLGEAAYDSVMIWNRTRIENKKPIVQGEGLTMTDVYNRDIYMKAAFFLHTLRYVMGDSLFFPAMKKLIADVKYPYNRFFTTQDVQQFFCEQAGKDLNPLFDFYLRTTNLLDIELLKESPTTYRLLVKNSPMPLPLDITTDTGTQRILTSNKPITITSKTQPLIDPNGYYFKKVTLE